MSSAVPAQTSPKAPRPSSLKNNAHWIKSSNTKEHNLLIQCNALLRDLFQDLKVFLTVVTPNESLYVKRHTLKDHGAYMYRSLLAILI